MLKLSVLCLIPQKDANASLKIRLLTVACASIAIKWYNDDEMFDMQGAIDLALNSTELEKFSYPMISDQVMHLETHILIRFPIFVILEGSNC